MRHNLAPNTSDLFLNLKVRRDQIITDSLNEVNKDFKEFEVFNSV